MWRPTLVHYNNYKECQFFVIKGWLREDQRTMSGVSRPSSKRFFGKFTCIPEFNLLKFWHLLFISHMCCVFKNWSHFSSIDVTPSVLRVRRWELCVLRVGECGAGVGEWVCSRWFCDGCVWALCVLSVGQCGASVGEWVCSRWLCGGCVCVWGGHCVFVNRGN